MKSLIKYFSVLEYRMKKFKVVEFDHFKNRWKRYKVFKFERFITQF